MTNFHMTGYDDAFSGPRRVLPGDQQSSAGPRSSFQRGWQAGAVALGVDPLMRPSRILFVAILLSASAGLGFGIASGLDDILHLNSKFILIASGLAAIAVAAHVAGRWVADEAANFSRLERFAGTAGFATIYIVTEFLAQPSSRFDAALALTKLLTIAVVFLRAACPPAPFPEEDGHYTGR
jgi:hypothetical protein